MAAMRWFTCAAVLASLGAVVRADDTPEGKVFLSKNEGKEGVVVTNSGLQYKVLVAGTAGGQHPKPNEKCKCHYHGKTVDGQEFDSSYKRGTPATFAPNQVIAGWHEAMQLMTPGATWELTIPSKLAYKDQQRGRFIKPGSVLVFKLEMISCEFAHPQAPVAVSHAKEANEASHDSASRVRSKRKSAPEEAGDSAGHAALHHKSRKSHASQTDHKVHAKRKTRSGAETGTLSELKALKKEMEGMIAAGDKVSKADMKKLRRKYEQQKLARKKRAREGRSHHDKHIK